MSVDLTNKAENLQRPWNINNYGMPYQNNWWTKPGVGAVNYPWYMQGQGGANQESAVDLTSMLEEMDDLEGGQFGSFKYRNFGLTPELAQPASESSNFLDRYVIPGFTYGVADYIGGPVLAGAVGGLVNYSKGGSFGDVLGSAAKVGVGTYLGNIAGGGVAGGTEGAMGQAGNWGGNLQGAYSNAAIYGAEGPYTQRPPGGESVPAPEYDAKYLADMAAAGDAITEHMRPGYNYTGEGVNIPATQNNGGINTVQKQPADTNWYNTPLVKNTAVMAGLGAVNNLMSKSAASDNRQQSYEDWRNNAFPSQSAMDAARQSGQASIASQLQVARKRYLSQSAARGVRGGSGQINAGMANIEQGGLDAFSKLLADIERQKNTPYFGPQMYPQQPGMLDPAMNYLALAQGIQMANSLKG